jgi:hypothetical protein
MANKSKYEEYVKDKLMLVEGWARDGLTNEQIAHNLGINPDTLYEYKKKYPEFTEALKRGKEVIDMEVENALLRSALGYKYREETVTNKGEIVNIEKFERANITAQIFWLKNRKPAEWRDKKEVVNIDGTDNLSKEEIEKKLAEYQE